MVKVELKSAIEKNIKAGDFLVLGNGVELSDLEDMYCQGEFRIIKADNIEISEVGGRI